MRRAKTMAEGGGNPSLGGYDDEFVNAVDEDLHCVICHLPLKEPILTKCGHRFCNQCINAHFERLERARQSLYCPADRGQLSRDKADIFPDKATERKILSFSIKCPSKSCQWSGELRSKDSHLDSCPHQVIRCPYAEMGCRVKVKRREVESHLQSATKLHLDFARLKLSNAEAMLNKTRGELEETKRKLDENLSRLEAIAGAYTWKISGFNEALRQAESGNDCLLESSYFYDHGYKCRLNLDVGGQSSGENTHLSIFFKIMKGQYDGMLSWPFQKKVTLTLIDQQENPDQRVNIVQSFTADPKKYKHQFKRPIEDENSGFGFCSFISHSKVKERRYIVDDTIFIQVQVE